MSRNYRFEYRTPIMYTKSEFEMFLKGYKGIVPEHRKPVYKENGNGNMVLFYGWEVYDQ